MMINYLIQTSLTIKNTNVYSCLIYLYIDDAKNFCRSSTLMISILRSLKRTIKYSGYNSSNTYEYNKTAENLSILYEDIFERHFRSCYIYYDTPNKIYNKIIMFNVSDHSIKFSCSVFNLPKRDMDSFEEDYLYEYIKEDRIKRNTYRVCENYDVKFRIERNVDLTIVVIDDKDEKLKDKTVINVGNGKKIQIICRSPEVIGGFVVYLKQENYRLIQENYYKNNVLSFIHMEENGTSLDVKFRMDKNLLYRTRSCYEKEEIDPLPLSYR